MVLLRNLIFWNNYSILLYFMALFIEASSEETSSSSALNPQNLCSDTHLDDSHGNHNKNKSHFFGGFCYEIVDLLYNFNDSRSYCQDKGGDIASMITDSESEFVYEFLFKTEAHFSNRVWNGQTSFKGYSTVRYDGKMLKSVKWNEYKPHGFPYFFPKFEGCYSVYVESNADHKGLVYRRTEDCKIQLNFMCKRKVGINTEKNVTAPESFVPQSGNCRTGWHAFRNNCYLPVGKNQNEWLDFKTAQENCTSLNGKLVSIRNEKEQVFVSFLMETLRYNTWLGFHDTTKYGVYTWLDQSPVTYTNWAEREPSVFGSQEKCVYLQYDSLEMGQWKDFSCDRKLPYICKAKIDESIRNPWIDTSTQCSSLNGWLKQGDSCFKLFNQKKSWVEAKKTCEIFDAHLISISNISVQTTFKYLSLDINSSSWIGLIVNLKGKFKWINGLPLNISKWDKNQPAIKGPEEACYVSSVDGFWSVSSCEATRPFVCQINTDKQIRNVYETIDNEAYPCYTIIDNVNIFSAFMSCHRLEGKMSSFHSRNKIEHFKRSLMTNLHDTKPFLIPLFRNEKGGFAWADGSPVDFVYWDKNEPSDLNEKCVEMHSGTLKWKVASCSPYRHSLCFLKEYTFYYDSIVLCHLPIDIDYDLPGSSWPITKETTNSPTNSEVYELSTENSHSIHETSWSTTKGSTNSPASTTISQLSTENSYSIRTKEQTLFIDTRNATEIPKMPESSEKSTQFVHNLHSSSSSSTLAAILVSVILIAIVLLGVYFYFNPQTLKRLRITSFHGASLGKAFFHKSKGLLIEENQDENVPYNKLSEK